MVGGAERSSGADAETIAIVAEVCTYDVKSHKKRRICFAPRITRAIEYEPMRGKVLILLEDKVKGTT